MSKEITARIKGLLALKGKMHKELAEYLGISPQSMQNKFNRGSFSAEDLIQIANFTGVELAFIETGTPNIVTFDKECIRKKE